MNTQFSRPRNDPYSNSYDPGWSNQSNISWQAQAPKNYAPQFHELYHQVEPSPRLDSDFQDQMLKFMSNMEQTIKSQGQTVTSLIQTLHSHSQSIARMEVQMKHVSL
jgi:hypothetical protein